MRILHLRKIFGLFSALVLPVAAYAVIEYYPETVTAGRIDVDNVTLNGNTVSTTNTNGNLLISPNGTGLLEYTPGTISTVPYLDASKRLVSSAVTPTELGYLTGVTSAIQTQLNLKAPLASPTFTGTITTPLSASRAVVTGASSELAASTTTAAEILHVNGVTSALCGINQSCTLTGKTLTAPIMDLVTFDGQGSTPANPAAGFYKVYVKDATGQPVVLNSSGVESALGGGGSSSGINLLAELNPGAESGTTNWDDTGGGTFTTTTTFADVGNSTTSFSYDASANNDYAANDGVNIVAGLYGQNCLAQFYYKGFDSNITVQVHDGTNIVASQALTAASTYTLFQLPFICPSTGALQLRFLASADAAIGYFDEVHLGSATNLSNVSQSGFIASGYFASVGTCTGWTRTNTTLGAFASDADCTGPVLEFNPGPGVLDTTDTDLPKFTINNLPPGDYDVYFSFKFVVGSGTATHAFGVSDGTTVSRGGAMVEGSQDPNHLLIGHFSYSTAGNRTFEVYGAASTSSIAIHNNTTLDRVAFRVYRWPNSSQLAVTAATSAMSWSGAHDSTCSWARTSSAFGDPTADATCTLDTLTNQNFGTVSPYLSGSDDLPGFTFTAPKAGRYFVCAHVSHAVNNQNAALRLWDGTTVIANATTSYSSGTTAMVPLCGIYVASTPGAKTLSVQTKSSAGTQAIQISVNTTAIEWSIVAIDQQMPAPILVNGVVNSSSGVSTVEVAKLNCDAGSAITSQHGTWVSSIGNIAAGACAVTLASRFSATPYCTAQLATTGGISTGKELNVDATSTTAVSVDCEDDASTACTDFDFILNCVGAK